MCSSVAWCGTPAQWLLGAVLAVIYKGQLGQGAKLSIPTV